MPKHHATAHNYAAARQLLEDLKGLPEFRAYVFPELFDNVSHSKNIEAAAAGAPCQIAVTPGGFELVNSRELHGGALVDAGVVVYVFTSSQYASGPAENEAVDALLVELLHTVCRFQYKPAAVHAGIAARLTGLADLDMITEAGFTDKVAARALSLAVRLNLSK